MHESDEMTNTQVRRTLSNLALVCRFFSSVALPRIFATMEFSGGVGVSGDQTPNTSRFCRALIKDQEPAKTLAQYVKTCRFTSWNGLDMSDTVIHSRDAFFSMYCNALRKMVSVDSVDLHLVLVDKRILRAIKKLQHLRSLRFSQCRFSKSLDLNELQAVARSLDLESFVIFDCRKGHIFHSAFTSALKFDYLRSLEVDEWTIIQRLADYEGHLPIQSLTIHHTRDALLLPDLFLRTPELSQLHIYRMDLINDIESIHFPGSTLPKLSFYDGPPALATVLVPSRPLSKIWLLGTLVELPAQAFLPPLLPPLEERTWDALKQSTASVREIAIPRHLYSIGFLKNYLPNVSVLKLSWYHGNWTDDIVESSDEVISVRGHYANNISCDRLTVKHRLFEGCVTYGPGIHLFANSSLTFTPMPTRNPFSTIFPRNMIFLALKLSMHSQTLNK